MSKAKTTRYTAAPAPPTDTTLRQRYEQILAVLAGTQTVAGAARALGLPRNHFQTILHRGLAGLIDGITPRPAGRPAKPVREAELEAENARLKAKVATLEERSAMVDRLLAVAGGVASGRTRLRTPKKKSPTDPDEGPTATALAEVRTMREQGLPITVCATAVGVSPSTLRRRLAGTRPRLRQRRRPDPERAAAARAIVRDTHGLPGATSLAKMTGLTRRQAAHIKRDECRRIERDRRDACRSVRVSTHGVIRGFDAMHLAAAPGRPVVLAACDAAVPFRTTLRLAAHYDSRSVADALASDFEKFGAPLVCRLDRAACQRTDEVLAVLREHGVLVLHGPPHYPRYYGQLERQNREHRAWLYGIDLAAEGDLVALLGAMRSALNRSWARRTLGWCTAEERWMARPALDVNRDELRASVEARHQRLLAHGVASSRDPDLAWRLAVEQTLTLEGLLEINHGVTC